MLDVFLKPTTDQDAPQAAGKPDQARTDDARSGDLRLSLRSQLLCPRTILALPVAVVVTFVLAHQMLDVSLVDTWTFLRQADLGLLLLAGGVFYLVYPIRGARWQILLANAGFRRDAGYPMPGFWGSARLLVLAAFANSVTVAQLGDASRALLLKKDAHVPFASTLGTILAERLIDVVVLVVMLGSAILSAYAGHLPPQATDILVMGVALAGVSVAVLASLRHLRPVAARLLPAPWHGAYARLEQGVVASSRRIPLLLCLSALGWLVEGATIALLAASVGVVVSPSGALVACLVASLLSVEPLTPGGLGATESGIVLVLTSLGVSPDAAAAVAVLNRVVNYLSLAVVGPLLYVAPSTATIQRRRANPLPPDRAPAEPGGRRVGG